jgi:hypothetical protein
MVAESGFFLLPHCAVGVMPAMIVTQKADFTICDHGFNPAMTVNSPEHALGHGTSDRHEVGNARGAPGSSGALDGSLFARAS